MLIGQPVGSFVVQRQIAQGGMGSIFEAVHKDTAERVVIKALHPHLSQDEQINRRFLNEARAAAAIRHPGVVEVFDFDQLDDGTLYIVMELVPGESLGAMLRRRGRLRVIEAVGLARQMAAVLVATHARGIIHRDLKPDNVMLMPDPSLPEGARVKILDFGIAKLHPEHQGEDGTPVQTRTGMLMGTPEFMAPEQVYQAGGVTAQADVYSLGVMLYLMLAGQLPFSGEWGSVILMQVHAAPLPLGGLRPGLPGGLLHLVQEMLRKDPGDRPAMAAVEERLRKEASRAQTRAFLRGPGRWLLAGLLGLGSAALVVLLHRC